MSAFDETKQRLIDGKKINEAELRAAIEDAEKRQNSASNATALSRARMSEIKEEAVDLTVQTGTFALVEFVDGASEKGIKVMGRDPRLLTGVLVEGVSLFGTIKGRSWARYTRPVGRGVLLSGIGAMARGAGQKWREERAKKGDGAAPASATDAAPAPKPIVKGLPALAEQMPAAEVRMSPPGRRGPPPVPAHRDDAPIRARRMPPLPQ